MRRLERHQEEPELLDSAALGRDEAARGLGDLVRVNRLLLSRLPVRRTLLPRIRRQGSPCQVLLDVGTGFGDIPAGLARTALRGGVGLRVVGVDLNLGHLLLGSRGGVPQHRVVATAAALPFRRGSVDWCLSTLFFHHFDESTNQEILDEMCRVARNSAVVLDLRRSRATLWLVRGLLTLIGVGRVARHDGELSVKRSYAMAEVARLVARKPVEELRRRFPCRFSLVLTGSTGPSSTSPKKEPAAAP